MPSEAAALAAAGELAGLGHLLVVVRLADARTRQYSDLPEGWWQARSVSAISADGDEAWHWASTSDLIRVEDVARRHGGFTGGGANANRERMLGGFDRDGLVYEAPAMDPVHATVDVPPPGAPAPDLACEGLGAASVLIEATRVVARGVFGDVAAMPEFAEWLFDDDYFELPFGAADFLDLLCENVSSDGEAGDVSAGAVPFVAALASDDRVPAGARAHLLFLLLRSATTAHRDTVSLADRAAALGESVDEAPGEREIRLAVEAHVPDLLRRWDGETDVCRLGLAALATVVPEHARPIVEPRLPELPAPAGSRRADVVALIRALLTHDVGEALQSVARWETETARHQATGTDPRVVALAVLPELIIDAIGSAAHADDE